MRERGVVEWVWGTEEEERMENIYTKEKKFG